MKLLKKRKIYLDYASSTLVDIRVQKLMAKIIRDFPANPSAIYSEGVKAKNVLENARAEIAKAISAHSDEIIFTGSGTESDALAIIGVINNYKLIINNKKPHIITTTIEHPAVLENCKMLEVRGEAEVTYVGVNENGIVNPKDIRDAIKENTVLVSVMYTNNEIGTIQPIQEIVKEIRHYRKMRPTPKSMSDMDFPLFHTDACQAMNYLFTENIEKLGVDLMSFNSSKIYGPKGVGILFKKRGINLSPIYSGGGQEFNLRSGTENVAGIAGVAEALNITNKIKEKESDRLINIRDYAIEKILLLSKSSGYEIILNGDKVNRLPNNINISIIGISSELLVIELDAKGIMVSERSACSSDNPDGSHIIKALHEAQNQKSDTTTGSLRISLGRNTTKKDLDYFISSLSKILSKYKQWK